MNALLNHLDANQELKKYISSPFDESTGDLFCFHYQLEKDYAVLYISNESRGGDLVLQDKKLDEKKLHSVKFSNNATRWQFFVAYDHVHNILTVSEYILDHKKPILHYSPQVYVPVMELILDMVGDGCYFFFKVREEVFYNVYHVSFIKAENSCHVRGNFNLQLVDLP